MYNEEAPFQQNLMVRNAIARSESMRDNNSILQRQQAVYGGAREEIPMMMGLYPSPDQNNIVSAYLLQHQRQIEAELIHSRNTLGSTNQLLQDFRTRQLINAIVGRSQGWNNIDLSRLLLPHEMDIQTAISQTRMTSLLPHELDIQTATTLTRMMLERNPGRPLTLRMAPIQESGDMMTGSTIPLSLPTCLVRSIDSFRMTEHPYYLRQQMEVFQANEYGIYQCGLCSEMPNSVKMEFAHILTEKKKSCCMGAGRPYWAESATQLGLVDTEDAGIRFIGNQFSDSN